MNIKKVKQIADAMANWHNAGRLNYFPKDFYRLNEDEKKECLRLFKRMKNPNKPFDETK